MSFVNTEWRDPITITPPLYYSDEDESIGDESEEAKVKRLEEDVNAIAEKWLRGQNIAFGAMAWATPLQKAGQLQIEYTNEEDMKTKTKVATITDAADLERLNGYKAARDAWKSAHPSKPVPTLPYI